MNRQPWPRSRPTDLIREATRLTDALAIALGASVRSGRRRAKLTQEALGARVGIHQTWVSRIELGRGNSVPLETWVRLGVALDQPLAISLSRPLGATRGPSDAGHLAMQEHLLALARQTERTATFELPSRPSNPAHSIDVCVRDARRRVLIIEEAWNTFGDIGAAIRSTHRKEAEAADLAETIDDRRPYRVATVWVVRTSTANRALIRRYPEVFAHAFPGSSRAWVQALTSGAPPPVQRGLVWADPTNSRIFEWRR